MVYDRCREAFIRQYIATALWSSTEDGKPMDQLDNELSSEAWDAMEHDCDKFLELHGHLLDTIDAFEEAAHDLWLTRNGHGAGFWDGDWPSDLGERFDKYAKSLGECDLYIGDDGLIYIT